MNENFSENLKKARRDARMTQAEVAKIVGVAKNTYCNWEQGTREPNILKIKALAKLFGVSVDYLVGFEKQDALVTAQNKYGKERVLAYLDALAHSISYQRERRNDPRRPIHPRLL